MNRQLATIQRIDEINPIEGADRIEVASVLGWKVVVQKGNFKPGDLCCYVEVDSVLPEASWSEFLRDKKFKVKTVRLRGQVSQGICLPLSEIQSYIPGNCIITVGTDVTGLLGITKWDPPMPVELSGIALGRIPSGIPKTDEPRIQSFPDVLERNMNNGPFYLTEKMDGCSCTIFYKDGLHVCSRNIDLKETDSNTFWKVARANNIEEILKGTTLCLQGELCGPKIQGNPLKLAENDIYFFNLFDYKKGEYLGYESMSSFALDNNLRQVIWLNEIEFLPSMDELISEVSGMKSRINTEVQAEGIVVRSVTEKRDIDIGRLSFKVLNPEYLLKS